MNTLSTKQHSLLLSCLMMLFCLFATSLQAQNNNESKTMTITIDTVDKDGNEATKIIELAGDEADENRVEAIVQENLTGDEVNVNVNVEVAMEGNSNSDNSKEIEVGDDMKIEVDGDKVYLNGEEIKDGDMDGGIRIIRIDEDSDGNVDEILDGMNIDVEALMGEAAEDGKEIRIIKKRMAIGDENNDSGFLGVAAEGTQGDTGITISMVVEGSPAEKMGLKVGDKILSIDGKTVNTFDELIDLMDGKKANDQVEVSYNQGDKVKMATATLAKRPNKTHRMMEYEGDGFNWKDCDPKNCTPEQRAKCCPETLSKSFKSCDPSACDPKSCPPWMCEEKAQMGVYIDESEDGKGVLLTDVSEGKGSERAGLQADDLIYKIDNTKITDTDQLIATIATYKPNDVVTVRYMRDGKKQKTKVTLGAKQVRLQKYQNNGCCARKSNKETIVEEEIIIITKDEDGEAMIPNNGLIINNTLTLDKLDLFPNPTSGEININFSGAEKIATSVTVLDASGKEVFKDNIANYNGTYSKKINLADNAAGLYFLRIQQGDKIYTEQIVVNKAK